MEMENDQKSDQNRPPNGRKWQKIEPWGCLGALWGASWRQDGARATTRAKIHEKCWTLGSPRGAKMELKSMKNPSKNRMNFKSDFETTFSRSWDEVGAKTSPK